ncbi:MAG TPA: hypothetical protein VHV27_06080 [Phenylobacterium sp.]|jgi:hypothetical protein|nr:hypothetical protein [Phenylobacterium sp.]
MSPRPALALTAALALAAAAAPAAAAPPTSLARSVNLVVIQVRRVDLPERVPGDCRVAGVVSQVLDGGAYHVGQLLTLDVPCSPHPILDAKPLRPTPFAERGQLDPQVLKSSRTGVARLDDDGRLIWEGPPIALRRGLPGALGGVFGYRILDPVIIPAAPHRTL